MLTEFIAFLPALCTLSSASAPRVRRPGERAQQTRRSHWPRGKRDRPLWGQGGARHRRSRHRHAPRPRPHFFSPSPGRFCPRGKRPQRSSRPLIVAIYPTMSLSALPAPSEKSVSWHPKSSRSQPPPILDFRRYNRVRWTRTAETRPAVCRTSKTGQYFENFSAERGGGLQHVDVRRHGELDGDDRDDDGKARGVRGVHVCGGDGPALHDDGADGHVLRHADRLRRLLQRQVPRRHVVRPAYVSSPRSPSTSIARGMMRPTAQAGITLLGMVNFGVILRDRNRHRMASQPALGRPS